MIEKLKKVSEKIFKDEEWRKLEEAMKKARESEKTDFWAKVDSIMRLENWELKFLT